jgi:hypothetical protein
VHKNYFNKILAVNVRRFKTMTPSLIKDGVKYLKF